MGTERGDRIHGGSRASRLSQSSRWCGRTYLSRRGVWMCRCFTATCTRQSAWRADDTVPDAPRLRKRRSASLCEGTVGSALQMGSTLMISGCAAAPGRPLLVSVRSCCRPEPLLPDGTKSPGRPCLRRAPPNAFPQTSEVGSGRTLTALCRGCSEEPPAQWCTRPTAAGSSSYPAHATPPTPPDPSPNTASSRRLLPSPCPHPRLTLRIPPAPTPPHLVGSSHFRRHLAPPPAPPPLVVSAQDTSTYQS